MSLAWQTAHHSLPGLDSALGAKHVLWRWEVAPDTHLSGSRAEIWSSCPHPRTPGAQCPAHLQERAQEQVRNPPSLGHTRGTRLCNASQEVWGCQHFGGSQRKPPPLTLGAPGAGGTDPPPPSPRGTPGTNPSHPQAVLGALCLTGGLGAEGDPAAAGLDMAATGGDRACSDTTDPGLGNRGKNLIRGCLLWQGCRTTGTAWPEPPAPEELPCPRRAGDWRCQWDYPNLWVFQGNVAAPAPATKHSPSVGLEGGTQEHPSSQMCHLWLSHCGKCSEVFAINWCQRIWMG